MIKNFKSIDELFGEIENDKKDNSPFAVRYPIRLIFCNNSDSFRHIIKRLDELIPNIIHLNTLLPHNDGWLTSDDIVNVVKTQTADSVVIPLSELIRFFPDPYFNGLMTTLFEIENKTAQRRCYIPILGLRERFEIVFFSRFHRRDKGAILWYLEDVPKKKINICQICFESDISSDLKMIKNTNDWLELWKHDSSEKVLCTSENMGYLYKKFLPDAVFQMEKIDTPKEYLENIRGFIVPFGYIKDETNFWKTLINETEKQENFQSYIHQHFNIKSFSDISNADVLKLWILKKDKYSKWLLAHWVRSQDIFNNSYLFNMMSDLKEFSDAEFIEQIWLKLFDISPIRKDMFEERKSYLNIIHNEYKRPFHSIEENLNKKISSLSDKPFEVRSDYLTNIAYCERKHIVESFKNALESDREQYKNIIRNLYPEFFYYLEWNIAFDNQESDNRIVEYFREYNLSKALNCKSGKSDTILNELNKDAESFYKWYYAIETCHHHLEDSHIVWIDALGAEWLPLLEYLIYQYGKENKYVEKKYICKSNLPTTTDCNRFDADRISELDDYIHKENPYTYPDDLIHQIELIKNIVQKEIIESKHDKIVVVSDHGFTFLAQKRFGNYKKFDFSESNHQGRCMWTDEAYQNDSEFMLHSVDTGDCKGKHALIALKHTSLHDTPCREVHGGATPEEILVPCLVVSNIADAIIYKVQLLTKEISVKNPVIVISVEPHPPVAPILVFSGERILFIKEKDDKWFSELKGLKPGHYTPELMIRNQKFELEIAVQSGMKERDLF